MPAFKIFFLIDCWAPSLVHLCRKTSAFSLKVGCGTILHYIFNLHRQILAFHHHFIPPCKWEAHKNLLSFPCQPESILKYILFMLLLSVREAQSPIRPWISALSHHYCSLLLEIWGRIVFLFVYSRKCWVIAWKWPLWPGISHQDKHWWKCPGTANITSERWTPKCIMSR